MTGWLDARGQAWKDQVAYVAIDPCAVYRSAITKALPHAVIVVDHFHLVRLANQAVTRVRQRVTRQVLGLARHQQGSRLGVPAAGTARPRAPGPIRPTPPGCGKRSWRRRPPASCSPRGSPRKNSATCLPSPVAARHGLRSVTGCSRSTTGALAPTCPRCCQSYSAPTLDRVSTEKRGQRLRDFYGRRRTEPGDVAMNRESYWDYALGASTSSETSRSACATRTLHWLKVYAHDFSGGTDGAARVLRMLGFEIRNVRDRLGVKTRVGCETDGPGPYGRLVFWLACGFTSSRWQSSRLLAVTTGYWPRSRHRAPGSSRSR